LESVNAGMARGAAWNVFLRLLDRTIGLLSTVVLARLLVPADFGLIALATSLAALLALLGAFGLDLALIQNPNADRRFFDTVWTFNVLFGIGLAAVLVLLANPAAHFYNESRLVHVIFGLAIARAISGFENVGIIAFRKNLEFDKEFKFLLYKRLATTFLATIPLAFVWRSYWALVGGVIAGSCFGLVLSYRLHPYRPRPSLGAMRELFGFSKWLQLAHIVGFASGRAADFIIGKAAGISALGSFTIAKDIANLPSAELAMPVHRGIFPGYAKISGDLGLLKRAYLRVTSVLVLITLPAGIGLGLVAQPVVLVFLGDKWNEVIPLIQILSVNGVLAVSLSTAAYVYLALGTTRRTASLTAVHVAVSLPTMLFLVPFLGVTGAAFALLAGTLATVPVNFRMMSRAVRLTLQDILGIIWRPVSAMLVMVGVTLVARGYWMSTETFGGNAVNLFATAGIGAAVYCGAVMLLWQVASRPDGAETFVLERMKSAAAACGSQVRMWLTR
jgi:lipopolysaccharide exporter